MLNETKDRLTLNLNCFSEVSIGDLLALNAEVIFHDGNAGVPNCINVYIDLS